jgi:hypothetical protein
MQKSKQPILHQCFTPILTEFESSQVKPFFEPVKASITAVPTSNTRSK